MPKIIINGKEIEFEKGMTVLQACELADVEIPRFCYHEKLSIAGNCRMCLVELEKSPKPIASCAMPAAEGMNIKTNTHLVEKARKGVMEFLLANHPLDCPVCDQGGECDLQDQSMYYGVDKSRFIENKRQVKEKYMGPLIKTQMTRCIHCTRCVRFATEVAGVPEIGAIGRGENMEITTYLEKAMESELSANVIDLCPVGALTSKPYAFEARPWELKKTESIDVMDAVGSNIRIDTYNWEVKRILPRLNNDINEEWISDKTRYSCDGLLKQRLDVPYIKKDNKLQKSNWDEAITLLADKIQSINPNEIGGHIGDMVNMENALSFKKLFAILKSKNLEFREKKFYINSSEKINYIFNSSIKGIEESDLILLIGSNPRHEATMLNARIRKTFVKKRIPIFSIGDPGELTYDYTVIGNTTDDLKKILDNEHEFSKKLSSSNKPIIIIGESALELESGKYIVEEVKNFLKNNNFISKEWNAFNFLAQNASTVGLIDLKVLSKEDEEKNSFFEKLNKNQFKLLYLLGSDNLDIKKDNEFIVYQGSHGDRGAEIADLVLPSAAFTEQNGLFENLEGRVQESKKASYPIGEALEDWKIFNLILKKLGKFNDLSKFDSLRKEVLNLIPNFTKLNELPNFEEAQEVNTSSEFISESVNIKNLDYFYTNSISRASKTMSECRQIKQKLKKQEHKYMIEYLQILGQEVYKIVFLLVPILVSVAMIVWLDRRVWGLVQKRRGPNVVGPFGLFQTLADALKYIFKEIIIPASANKVVFILAPIVTMTLALVAWAVIPMSEELVLSDINVGILYLFAVSSLGVYGIIMGGWASNSKYPFLGAIRSAAQMVSYEVSIGIIIINVLLCVGSLNLNDIVIAQKNLWYVIPLFPMFVIFFISALAETNRPPFDLPEAEAELVAGYQTEYSGMMYAMFWLGEYANILLMCAMGSILFLGGWLPIMDVYPLNIIPAPIWMISKILFLFLLFALIKAIVPRYRYDQLMRLGWKIFLPFSLIYLVFTASFLFYFDKLPKVNF